jgi:galactose mutarotase-like enzyme
MPTLFNQPFTIDELQRMTGCMDQLAGIRLVEYADGRRRGMRAADVWTGSGLRFTILFDRGMDIGPAEFAGKPLAWMHPALATPAFYEPVGGGFGRTFGGGLLVTCGMNHFGPAEHEGNEFFPQHGRVSHIPAEEIGIHCGWEGEVYQLEVEGKVRQAILYGENLRLTRRITTSLGATSLHIEDRVANLGYRPTSLMMLYHCNFGFPVVSPDTELIVDDESVRPRDELAQPGLGKHTRFGLPEPDFQQQVFFHRPRPDASGYATATLLNHAINFGAFVRYREAELPVLTQWKNTGAGDYLCGLEPATNAEAPRAELRERGELRMLAPGEEVGYSLEIGIANPG